MNLTTPTTRLTGLALASALAATATSAQTLDFEKSALNALSLEGGEITNVVLNGAPGQSAVASFEYEGQQVTLDLEPFSVLKKDAVLLQDIGGGELVPFEVELTRTLRGSAREMPGALVAGGWMEDGFYGRIRQADGSDIYVQPLVDVVEGATDGQYVVYSSDDLQDVPFGCGGALLANQSQGIGVGSVGGPVGQDAGRIGVANGSATFTAELGVDADFEYYQEEGSTTTGTTNQINLVINTMNLQYESEVDITHVISTLIVRSTSNDPYTSTSATTLLDEFQDEWNGPQSGQPRDIAQLFTGKSIQGGTIGIAYLGVICNSTFGYGLVESNFNNNFGFATDLSAHELGHNWNADHCSCTSNTMNPFITGTNTFSVAFTRGDITAHRDSRTCLDTGPIVPNAAFSAAPVTGIAPLIVNFTDESTGNPSSFSWDFGDGNTSSLQNTANAYLAAGTYTVSLTVSNSAGSDTQTEVDLIVVDGPVSGGCTIRNGTGANPNIFACSNDPVVNGTWTSTIDAGSIGVGGLSFVFGYSDSLPPVPTAFGELLIDPGSSFFLLNTSFAIGGIATHSEAIPNDTDLIGLGVATQGFLNASGGGLTNAVDLVIGS